MKKPIFRIDYRILKNSQFSLKMKTYFVKRLLWKDKYDTPRVEILPQFLISWLWFQVDIIRGNDADWEWWLWVTKYCDNNIDKAIETWGWGQTIDGEFVKDNPHLKYNKYGRE